MSGPSATRRSVACGLGALALVALLLAAGCGIPTDGEPQVITADSTTTAPPTPQSGGSGNMAVIYLTSPTSDPEGLGTLVPVTRNLDAPPDPTSVLEAVLAEETQEDLDAGRQSVIPPGTSLESVASDGDLLTVSLSESWNDLQGPEALQGYAQVVLSLTELDSVRQVRFLVEGEPIQASSPSGDKGVVARADYDELEQDDG
ncbi:MAG: GerMN domain-containing protein [Iamia sp.]